MEMSSAEASQSELLLQSMAEDGDEGDAEFLATQFPDWQLIDEISIRLLEQGIGTFDTLQRALPSVALTQIEEIHLDSDAPENPMDEGNNKKSCSAKRMLKLFRLAQLQIDYLLKSQQEMVEKVAKTEERAKRLKKENKALREQFTRGGGDNQQNGTEGIIIEGPQWGRELFRCNECTKIFLHANFLTEHIQRRHGGNLESATRLSSVKNKAERVLGLGNAEQQQQSTSMFKSNEDGIGRQWGNKNDRNRTMKRKSTQQQRGQSQGRSGTFRKRTDEGGGGGRSVTEVLKSRQQNEQQKQQNWHHQDGMDKSSCPSSSFGEDIAMALPETSMAGKERRKTLTLSEDEKRG